MARQEKPRQCQARVRETGIWASNEAKIRRHPSHNEFACPNGPSCPLAPGKPAGVNQAQVWNIKTLAVIGAGLGLTVGFALLISGGTSVTTPISGGAGNSVVVSPTTTK